MELRGVAARALGRVTHRSSAMFNVEVSPETPEELAELLQAMVVRCPSYFTDGMALEMAGAPHAFFHRSGLRVNNQTLSEQEVVRFAHEHFSHMVTHGWPYLQAAATKILGVAARSRMLDS